MLKCDLKWCVIFAASLLIPIVLNSKHFTTQEERKLACHVLGPPWSTGLYWIAVSRLREIASYSRSWEAGNQLLKAFSEIWFWQPWNIGQSIEWIPCISTTWIWSFWNALLSLALAALPRLPTWCSSCQKFSQRPLRLSKHLFEWVLFHVNLWQ